MFSRVAEYNLKATYGNLLDLVEKAFNKQKPLFILSIYDPSRVSNRQWRGT